LDSEESSGNPLEAETNKATHPEDNVSGNGDAFMDFSKIAKMKSKSGNRNSRTNTKENELKGKFRNPIDAEGSLNSEEPKANTVTVEYANGLKKTSLKPVTETKSKSDSASATKRGLKATINRDN